MYFRVTMMLQVWQHSSLTMRMLLDIPTNPEYTGFRRLRAMYLPNVHATRFGDGSKLVFGWHPKKSIGLRD